MIKYIKEFLNSKGCSIILENLSYNNSLTYKCLGFIGEGDIYYSLLLCYNSNQIFCPKSDSKVLKLGSQKNLLDYGLEKCCRVFYSKEDYIKGKYSLPNEQSIKEFEGQLSSSICDKIYSVSIEGIELVSVEVFYYPIMMVIVKFALDGNLQEPVVFRINDINLYQCTCSRNKKFIYDCFNDFGKVGFIDGSNGFMEE